MNIRKFNDCTVAIETEILSQDLPQLRKPSEFAAFCETAKRVLRYLPAEYDLHQGFKALGIALYLFGKDYDEVMPEDIVQALDFCEEN